ncbi:adenine-specific DNA-methyltransferase [Pseudonocardia sediminis]|uniref:Adenine-specific DNA-methyltransferase n=1 Tax=Pseudonocardia sediminis TaxID=1397368 RepID=A0A4Q7UT87_PSEST|nr:DNA methyltransferase [Pseudonocardia sediminis]RZT84906.1 adenine-specific DNA-methyltransferase [Pseudonocardia sediminis]
MSRLNDLLRQLRTENEPLAKDIEREVQALAERRAFGLNFERHVPEAVELPGRRVRKGDKVRQLPPRGELAKSADERVWLVTSIERIEGTAIALLESVDGKKVSRSPVQDLVVVAEFRDSIYPGLVSTGKIERGGDKPFHAVINAENYHALQTLLFTHRGKVDCIYIDPPYNTGAKDWKYNNSYVEGDDLYRHSKWLAFMERRLLLAKEILNPDNSVLIITIDEKEYLRLGLLLEQTFPGARVQMVTSVINATGVIRATEFTRNNEYIYFVSFGDAKITPERSMDGEVELLWNLLQRREDSSRRHGPVPRLDQFYPIYVERTSGRIKCLGKSLTLDESRLDVPSVEGCEAVFPIRPDGTEMTWGVTPGTLQGLIDKGYVRVNATRGKYSVYYLTSGKVKDIAEGRASITGRRPDGSVIAVSDAGKVSMPTSTWERPSHNAQSHGTKLLSRIVPNRRFPFPKSLYAVEDCLRFFIGDKPDATVIDFFSGSGTTTHAVMRLNRQDGGRRRSIAITNNEVGSEEQRDLRKKGFRPGDSDWESWGICDYITKPRIAASVSGLTPEGEPIKGDYKFTDEFPLTEGFEENVEFFTLTYEAPLRVASNREFRKIAPLLWIRAGSQGRRIEAISMGWDVAETYGVLADLDHTETFLKAVAATNKVAVAYIVTDEDRLFESVSQELPDHIEPVRLYEAYLRNFEIESGRGSL